ncbi:MAG TPA: YbhB/YbcL family Raf kinase inhibitor-like protein [Stellaceae bacterium]
MPFLIDSPAFGDGDPIPARYTQDGDNLSPPLTWRDAPPGTQGFALVLYDYDAPDELFRHWAVYDIPADVMALHEGIGSAAITALPQGINDFGNRRYDGPAPPPDGRRHIYHFRLAALSVGRLDLSARPSAAEVWDAAQAHLIREAEMVGIYERPAPGPIPERIHRQPSKGSPVIYAGDAGGPNDGRNITTADLDRDAGKPPPDRLEAEVYNANKPKGDHGNDG